MIRLRLCFGLVILFASLAGCPMFLPFIEPVLESALVDQVEKLDAVKTVIGGNSERAVLGKVNAYFGPSNLGEPLTLDLGSGDRTATGVDLSPLNTWLDKLAVQTDGDFLVWSDELYDPTQLYMLDLRTGERRELLAAGQIAGVAVETWVLGDGRAVARGPTAPPVDAAESGPSAQFANVSLDLRSGTATRVAEFQLPSPTMLIGTSAFVVQKFLRPGAGDEDSDASPFESRLFETNVETGESRLLATLPDGEDRPGAATPNLVVLWAQRHPGMVVTWYDRSSGAINSFERSHGPSDYVQLKAAGDAGFVIGSSGAGTLSAEFVGYDGHSVVLQRASFGFGNSPIEGNIAILGDRVIWNDFSDGRLRYYSISTGERGLYE